MLPSLLADCLNLRSEFCEFFKVLTEFQSPNPKISLEFACQLMDIFEHSSEFH